MKYEERTECKLRYAKVHLDELIVCPRDSPYDDFQRAHCESFLFHLIGARDSFLQEINIAHGLGLREGMVNFGVLYDTLREGNIESPAFNVLKRLQEDEDLPSWLNKAVYFRNKGMHRLGTPWKIQLGGADHDKTELIDSRKKKTEKGRTSGKDFIDDFANWYNKMKKLVEQLREKLPQS